MFNLVACVFVICKPPENVIFTRGKTYGIKTQTVLTPASCYTGWLKTAVFLSHPSTLLQCFCLRQWWANPNHDL